MKRRLLTSRPEWFDLDLGHPLGNGLMFAGLGRTPMGLRYHDSSPYGNHGTLSGMDVPASSTSGWYWDGYLRRWAQGFDGINDYIAFPASVIVGINSTLAWWEWRHNTDPWNAVWEEASFSYGYMLEGDAGNLYYQIGGNSVTFTSYDPSRLAWHHWALTRKDVTCELFIDGVSKGVQVGTGNFATVPTKFNTIGAENAGNAPLFVGRLSDMIGIGRALSPAEIRQLADPSNVMLSGLIRAPRRVMFAAAAAGGTAYDRTADDALGLTDAASRIAAYSRSQADDLGLNDAATRIAAYSRSQADDLGMTDAATRAFGFSRTQADDLGIADIATRFSEYLRTQADNEGLGDAATRVAEFARTEADALGLTDEALAELTLGFLAAWYVVLRANQ